MDGMHAPPGTRGFQRPTQPFRRDRRPSNTRPRRRPSRENRAFHGATATPHRASPAGAATSHRARPGTGRTLAGLRNVVLVTASVGVPGPRNGVVSPRETNDGASHGRVGAPPLSLSPGLSGFPWWLVAVQNVCAADDDDRRGRVGAGIRQRKGIPPAEADGARDRSRCYRQEGARTEHDSKPVRARRGREGGHRCKSPDEIHTGFTNQKIGSRNVVSGSRCPPPRTSRRRTRSAPTRRARSTAGRGASTTGTTVPKRSHRRRPGRQRQAPAPGDEHAGQQRDGPGEGEIQPERPVGLPAEFHR